MAYYRAPKCMMPLVTAAASSYAANCALGAAAALQLVDTSRFRWVHHTLYIATSVLSAVAASAAWLSRSQPAGRRIALALVPAFIPLALIPYFETHTTRHPLVALAAAPFFVASFLLSRHPKQRR